MLVYELGERLMLPDLKKFSAKHVIQSFEMESSFWCLHEGMATQFAALLQSVYVPTSKSDTGLRTLVTAHCVDHLDEFEAHPEWQAVKQTIIEHEPYGWQLGLTLKANARKAERAERGLERRRGLNGLFSSDSEEEEDDKEEL